MLVTTGKANVVTVGLLAETVVMTPVWNVTGPALVPPLTKGTGPAPVPPLPKGTGTAPVPPLTKGFAIGVFQGQGGRVMLRVVDPPLPSGRTTGEGGSTMLGEG